MSNVSTPAELDFWEFVGCGVCHNGFVKETGALSSVPFWLTDCGHVVCNNHLSEYWTIARLHQVFQWTPRIPLTSVTPNVDPDQSCMVCGAQCMHLIPLAREVMQ